MQAHETKQQTKAKTCLENCTLSLERSLQKCFCCKAPLHGGMPRGRGQATNQGQERFDQRVDESEDLTKGLLPSVSETAGGGHWKAAFSSAGSCGAGRHFIVHGQRDSRLCHDNADTKHTKDDLGIADQSNMLQTPGSGVRARVKIARVVARINKTGAYPCDMGPFALIHLSLDFVNHAVCVGRPDGCRVTTRDSSDSSQCAHGGGRWACSMSRNRVDGGCSLVGRLRCHRASTGGRLLSW